MYKFFCRCQKFGVGRNMNIWNLDEVYPLLICAFPNQIKVLRSTLWIVLLLGHQMCLPPRGRALCFRTSAEKPFWVHCAFFPFWRATVWQEEHSGWKKPEPANWQKPADGSYFCTLWLWLMAVTIKCQQKLDNPVCNMRNSVIRIMTATTVLTIIFLKEGSCKCNLKGLERDEWTDKTLTHFIFIYRYLPLSFVYLPTEGSQYLLKL